MRRDGDVGMNKPRVAWSPIGRSIGDHVCWPFRGHDAMTVVARPYVAEGLDRGERVTYVGEGDPSTLRHDLDGLPDLNEHLERGRLQLVPAATLPASDPSVHPASELPVLAGMTSQALDAGYAGLRMFTNGTSRARDPAQRAHLVGYEHLIDRFCLEHALTMLCAYDAVALRNSAVAELVCVHALAHGDLSPFQIHATSGADAALAGEVDVFCLDQLEQALERIGVGASGGKVVIDAADLKFIDIRGLLTLDRHAIRTEATLVLRSPPAVVTQLLTLVDLIALQVEGKP
jgi:MEDS: MEthanogen/methylotroph, DcmR Sensory domain/STAS domain